jgi:hypothetical protein
MQGIRVAVTPRPGVSLGSILTGGSVSREGAHQAATVSFNDMYSSESRELLVTVDVPAALLTAAAAEGQPAVLADVCVSFTDTRSGSVQQVSGVLTVGIAKDGEAAGCECDPDPLVVMTAARYEAVAALENADKLAQGGKAKEAAELLQQVTEKLQATSSCVPAGAAAHKEITMLQEQTRVVRDTILDTQEEREVSREGGREGHRSTSAHTHTHHTCSGGSLQLQSTTLCCPPMLMAACLLCVVHVQCNTRTAVTKVAAWGLKNQRAAASGVTQALPSHSAYANASQAAQRCEAVKQVTASLQTKAGRKP